MKKFLFISIISIFLTACSSQPHWQTIADKYIQALIQQDQAYNGKIRETLMKAQEELYTTNEYPTEEEKQYIKITQLLLRDAIMEAKQDIMNYPLENDFMKAYKRFDLLRQGKITYSQAVLLAKRDANETRAAQETAARQAAAYEQARWNSMTRNIGKGLGKTPYQQQMDQERRVTNCSPSLGGGFSCTSY